MKKAIFLDRDGTINRDSTDYIKSLAEFEIFPFVSEALKILQQLNYELIIITNQSGIGRGFITEIELEEIHNYFVESMQNQGVKISDIYICPHLPDEKCDCRKPKLKNLEIAQKAYNLEMQSSWFIGDSEKDIISGNKANCKTILVLSGIRGITKDITKKWKIEPDFIAKDLLEAAQIIKRLDGE